MHIELVFFGIVIHLCQSYISLVLRCRDANYLPCHYTLATEHLFSLVSGRASLCILWNELYQMLSKKKICAYIHWNELRAVENVLLLLPSIYSLESYRNCLDFQTNHYSHTCCLLQSINHYKKHSSTLRCFCIPERFSFVFSFSF